MTDAIPLIIVGAAGVGRETADIVNELRSAGHPLHLLGILDDYPTELHLERLESRGIPFLGTTAEWIDDHTKTRAQVSIAIADPATRARLTALFQRAGYELATLISPAARIGSDCSIGDGSIIYPGVSITTNVRLGYGAILNPGVLIGHDAHLGDFVSANPGSAVSGEVTVGDTVLIGTGATILQGRHVGQSAIIGAKALVTHNVPDGVTVKGVPGRW